MACKIASVDDISPAARRNIRPGELLARINGHKIKDAIDYIYYSYDGSLLLELRGEGGRVRLVRVKKAEGEPLGLKFDPPLMDSPRACSNRCVFCFVDQLPRGLRSSLYFKDDDYRLSFLQGNYVTLTNLTRQDIERIVELRLSPLHVSVHSTEPGLHSLLLGNPDSPRALETMRRLALAGIEMHCQIVCCPGINDGGHLERTMRDLAGLHPAVRSVSVVPVGLTRYREGLFRLRPFDAETALSTVRQVERFGEKCLRRLGTRLVFPADELYIKAGLEVPGDSFYEGYPQLENGVGMIRLLLTEAQRALEGSRCFSTARPFSIATGAAAFNYLQKILNSARERYGNIKGKLYMIENEFFGRTVDVAGLITGGDLVRQLEGKDLGERLLITRNMLRQGEDVFLDGTSLSDLKRALGVDVRVVEKDGADLVQAMLGY